MTPEPRWVSSTCHQVRNTPSLMANSKGTTPNWGSLWAVDSCPQNETSIFKQAWLDPDQHKMAVHGQTILAAHACSRWESKQLWLFQSRINLKPGQICRYWNYWMEIHNSWYRNIKGFRAECIPTDMPFLQSSQLSLRLMGNETTIIQSYRIVASVLQVGQMQQVDCDRSSKQVCWNSSKIKSSSKHK